MCVVAVPLALVLVLAYAAFAGGKTAEQPQIALGASGGAFHPVAGNFRPDETSLDDCSGEEYSCRQQAFGNVAYRQGAKAALTLFDEQIASDEFVSADCHRIGHVIGSAAFARYEGNVAKTFALGSSTCASGYYHGILERAFVGVNTKTKLVDVARSLCDGSGVRRRGFLDYQCRHGLGHGLMIQTGYDLPLALSTCAELETRWDDVVCTGGAFMENVTTRFGFRSSWLSEDDPLDPCGRIPLRNQRSCYLRAAVRVLSFHDNDFEKAAETCAGLEARWAQPLLPGLRLGMPPARRATRPPRSSSSAVSRETGRATASSALRERSATGSVFPARSARPGSVPVLRPPIATRATPGSGSSSGCSIRRTPRAREACSKIAGAGAVACADSAIAEVRPDGREAWG